MIVRAAIKYQLYPHDDTGGEVILPLHRHGDGGIILKALGFEPGDFKIIEQGFLTEEGEFLGRFDALCEAVECGQLSDLSDEQFEMIIASDKLMSEDLW